MQRGSYRSSNFNENLNKFHSRLQNEEDICCNINPYLICSLFPMFMLLLLSIYSTIDAETTEYTFEPTTHFKIEQETSRYHIKYWVPADSQECPKDLNDKIENHWIQNLLDQCLYQINRKEYLIETAIISEGDTKMLYYELANKVNLSSCIMLDNLNLNNNLI